MRAQELPGQPHRQRICPIFRRDVFHRGGRPGDTCIIDKDIEPPEPCHGIAEKTLHLPRIGYIADPHSQSGQGLSRGIQRRLVDIANVDLGPSGKESLRGGSADAGGRAGYDDPTALEGFVRLECLDILD